MVHFFNSRVPVKCRKIDRDLGVGACEKPSGFNQGLRSKFLSGGAKEERVRQIGVGGGNA